MSLLFSERNQDKHDIFAPNKWLCAQSIARIFLLTDPIGVETHLNHRHKGLATATTTATIAYALRYGLQDIWWICSAHNAASVATAEKVGFTKQFETDSYFFILDEIEHQRQVSDENK